MDTTKLVVGRDVFLISGCYHAEGKIVETTSEGVKVLLQKNPLPGKDNVVWEFDSKGEALNCMGTAEYGPFTIVEGILYAIWEEENLYPPVLHSLHTSESEAVELAEKLDRENFPRYTVREYYKGAK